MGRTTAVTLGTAKDIAQKNATKLGLNLSAYLRLLILEADKKENK